MNAEDVPARAPVRCYFGRLLESRRPTAFRLILQFTVHSIGLLADGLVLPLCLFIPPSDSIARHFSNGAHRPTALKALHTNCVLSLKPSAPKTRNVAAFVACRKHAQRYQQARACPGSRMTGVDDWHCFQKLAQVRGYISLCRRREITLVQGQQITRPDAALRSACAMD
jgi:hypothetical protein